mmetsp:Transcript_36201/g.56706  ORF Transcript_36201/g.56706 Transcript_36201/m.56706 type:complete len:196 (-) Transcript_36201:11-598(-)
MFKCPIEDLQIDTVHEDDLCLVDVQGTEVFRWDFVPLEKRERKKKGEEEGKRKEEEDSELNVWEAGLSHGCNLLVREGNREKENDVNDEVILPVLSFCCPPIREEEKGGKRGDRVVEKAGESVNVGVKIVKLKSLSKLEELVTAVCDDFGVDREDIILWLAKIGGHAFNLVYDGGKERERERERKREEGRKRRGF